jgi:two-component system nitrogen regulation response regulator GlnG
LVLHFVEPDGEHSKDSYGLIGESDAIRATRLAVSRVADLDVTVLLRGESGTGKELVARAIHENGPRAGGPLVAVNLSAVTPSLAASELFGAVKGAYTGAVADRKGLFASADGGTLFLDEVGDCPAEVQAMLLRALETSEVCPVGSRRPKKVDVRLIAATDSNLEAKARSGVFKEPLLHRLSTYEIRMSPLRQRRDDVGRLMLHFADEARRSLGEALPKTDADAPPWIPAELAARFVRYDWPGNVRQLRNLVWQLVIDGRDSEQLRVDERVQRLFDGTADATHEEDRSDNPAPRPAKRRPASITEDELVEAMEKSAWNVTDAALDLGISRASLYELIKRNPNIRTAEELEEDEVRRALKAHDGDVVAAAAKLRVSPRGLGRRAKRLAIL